MLVEITERELELILHGLRELRNNKAARGQWRLPAEIDRLIESLQPQQSPAQPAEEPAGGRRPARG